MKYLLLVLCLAGCSTPPHVVSQITCDPFCFLQVKPPANQTSCLVIEGDALVPCTEKQLYNGEQG